MSSSRSTAACSQSRGIGASRLARIVCSHLAECERRHAPERGEAAEAHAHPRVTAHIIDFGSWSEDDLVQELWAGLLASSCTPDGDDDSNLMFVDFLNRLSLSEVKLLGYVCRSTPKAVRGGGWVVPAHRFRMTLDERRNVSGLTDQHRLDRELDHLRSLGLLTDSSGFDASDHPGASDDAEVTPMPLALRMWARCRSATPVRRTDRPTSPSK
jgi:hypothetical protein